MSPVTHALLPLFLGHRWLPKRTDGSPSWAASGAVAFAGVLPDVLYPHLGLDERHAAFSHSLVAWSIFVGLLGLAATHRRLRPHREVLVLCGAAYAAHIVCDLIAYVYLVYRWLPLRRRITRPRRFEPSRGEA
jgi:membrane-bound metal-dependent hydrolase YbcI (DUF457 family)